MGNIGQLHDARDRDKGLFRTLIAGTGQTLVDAFEKIEYVADIERMEKHPHRDLRGARFNLTPDDGNGYWEFTQIANDVYVIVTNFAYKDSRAEFVPGDGLIQFFFTLSGDLTMGVSRTEPLRINRPSLLVLNQPEGEGFHEWTPPNANECWVAITLRPHFLVNHVCGSLAKVPSILDRFVEGVPGKLAYCQVPLNAQMIELADKLVNNPHEGSLRLVYTEAVTLELLCVAIASFGSRPRIPHEHYSERELRCLYAARNVLTSQMAPAPTTAHVARRVGMNETSLKRGFKAIFGETIFDYSVRCRMHHAMTLLREEQKQVARVAEAVGYGHQTSFATAFRRHFGMRPKDVRRASVASR
jgi:AraC-like DNA-binding protein